MFKYCVLIWISEFGRQYETARSVRCEAVAQVGLACDDGACILLSGPLDKHLR